MGLVLVVLACALGFLLAYRFYGALLARLLKLDDSQPTPAVTQCDNVDYVPTNANFLMSQHLSAIAAAGPIAGPIIAGVMFGWLPALIWIVLGAIFIGGVHDFTSLVASIRHKARSIAEILREHMTRRSYALFLAFIWITLVYIIVAFTDIVATSFVGVQNLTLDATADAITDIATAAPAPTPAAVPTGAKLTVTGGAIASSSLLYLALPLVMGLLLKYTKLSVNRATMIFLPLVGVAIWAGPYVPFDLAGALHVSNANAVKIWDALLLGYCLVAGALPVWLLLQPRGHLGGYFLYIAVLGGFVGLLLEGVLTIFGLAGTPLTINYPAFRGWSVEGQTLAPILMITIACGACSGFHCLIASGTTSKQLQRESDAKPIGYGTMLVEGMVAVLSLACVMVLTQEAAKGKSPSVVYASGLGRFLSVFGIPASFAISFALLAFTTFVYDTLDVCTRLGRFVIQELTGWSGRGGRWFGTAITALVPLFFVTQTATNAQGKALPAWQVFWGLFGASNQLLAALALLCVAVWLWRTRRAWWVWIVVGIPMLWMYVMSVWALLLFVRKGFLTPDGSLRLTTDAIPWAAGVLALLAGLLLIEAVRTLMQRGPTNNAPPAVRQTQPA